MRDNNLPDFEDTARRRHITRVTSRPNWGSPGAHAESAETHGESVEKDWRSESESRPASECHFRANSTLSPALKQSHLQTIPPVTSLLCSIRNRSGSLRSTSSSNFSLLSWRFRNADVLADIKSICLTFCCSFSPLRFPFSLPHSHLFPYPAPLV